MGRLTGKVAIVTGASSGIGRAAAALFAREGAKVVIGARRRPELTTLAREIEVEGAIAIARAGDVRDESFAATLVETAVSEFGGLDIGFNNAGALGELGPAKNMSLANWTHVIETNLTSTFLCAKHQIPAMLERGKGSLIFTSTFVGSTVGFPGMAAYAASKAGVVGLVQVLAAELGARGVRANALLPGGVDTPAGRVVANTPETRAFVANLHAVKRTAQPDEIARAALFLASDESSFMTGAAMVVDGGVSINRT
jgi:NAD(P)-dependent dehydrogenase (short-subunit alcohol dehydrogenase family)